MAHNVFESIFRFVTFTFHLVKILRAGHQLDIPVRVSTKYGQNRTRTFCTTVCNGQTDGPTDGPMRDITSDPTLIMFPVLTGNVNMVMIRLGGKIY